MWAANDPLVAPVPVSAGSWPASFGNDGGRASKIGPNPVTLVIVGGAMETPTDGIAGPPGTGVRLGAGDAPADADPTDVAGATGLQAAATKASTIPRVRIT